MNHKPRDDSVLRFRLGPSGDFRRVPFVPRKKREPYVSANNKHAEPVFSVSLTPPSSVSSSPSTQQESTRVPLEFDPLSDVQQYYTLQSFILGSSDVFCLQKRLRKQELSSMQDVHKGWIALALQDSAFFHAALSHYIGVEDLDERQGDPVRALEHRMKALSVVNERLQSPQIATCNATIAAVASICAYEASNGSSEVVMAHMKGLEHLVKMRGGFRKAGFAEPLQRLVAWADLLAAFALNIAPKIVPFEDRSTKSVESDKALFDFVDYHDQIDDILRMLRALSNQLTRGLRTADQHSACNQVSYTAHRSLLYLLSRPQLVGDCSERLTCLAAAIFAVTCLRDIGSHARIVQDLATRLMDAMIINGTTLSSPTVRKARRLVWILFCGGVVVSQPSGRKYFAKWLIPLCVRLKLHSWDDAVGILHSIAWNDSWGTSHQHFWQQIVQAQV